MHHLISYPKSKSIFTNTQCNDSNFSGAATPHHSLCVPAGMGSLGLQQSAARGMASRGFGNNGLPGGHVTPTSGGFPSGLVSGLPQAGQASPSRGLLPISRGGVIGPQQRPIGSMGDMMGRQPGALG